MVVIQTPKTDGLIGAWRDQVQRMFGQSMFWVYDNLWFSIIGVYATVSLVLFQVQPGHTGKW